MSSEMLLGAVTALWLGIMTSISPCPLATNIAAISFIGKNLGNARGVLAAGLVYTLGRMLAYSVVGALAVAGILSIPGLSYFLQNSLNKWLGPVLIMVGLFLLEILSMKSLPMPSSGKLQTIAARSGVWGAGLLGIIFALSFCPVTAALFFGSLIPLSVGFGSSVLYPSIFGAGTGLPVIIFAFILAFSANTIGKAFSNLSKFEYWMRRITGVIFILAGLYNISVYLLGIF